MNTIFRYITIVVLSVSYYTLYSQSIPSALPGLQAWWSADSLKVGNGNPVETWTTNNNEFLFVTQPTAANRPTLVDNVLNGKPVVRFDGVNDYLDGGDILDIGSDGQTIFIITKTNTNVSYYISKSIANNGINKYAIFSNNNFSYEYVDNDVKYLTFDYFTLNYTIITSIANPKDGKISFSLNSNLSINSNVKNNYNFNSIFNFLIGAYNNSNGTTAHPNAYLNGDIAEIIIYNRPLSQLERQDIENYLRMKYFPGTERLQFSLGADIIEPYSLAPITLTVPPKPYYVSYEWNTGATTASIQVQNSGTYWVKAIDDWGYEYYDTITISKPSLQTISDGLLCQGDTIIWNCGISGAYTYAWSTGANTQSIAITQAGTYSISITDNLMNTIHSLPVTITLDNYSAVASLGPDTALCVGNKIELIHKKAETVQYTWSTGASTPEIEFTEAGTFSLIATNTNGCKAYDTIVVTQKGIAPQVSFSLAQTCQGDQTVLTGTSIPLDASTIVETQWIFFSDTLIGNQVTYVFPAAGEHAVQVRATTDQTCVGVLYDNVQIHSYPIVQFSPPKACQYADTRLVSSSTVANASLQSFEWTVEGEQYAGSELLYIFEQIGSYPVTLRVSSSHGCSAEATQTIEVREAPQVTFVHTHTCQGEPAFFFDKTKYVSHNTVIEGKWMVDGVSSPYTSTLGYLFVDSLNHTVKLEVKTINGCIVSNSKQFKVSPAASMSLPDIHGCIHKEVIVNHASNTYGVDISSYSWIIQGKEYTEPKPVVTFDTVGSYPVQLSIRTAAGCSAGTTGQIIIEKPPVANFSFYPEFGALPFTVDFTNTSQHADSYIWRLETNTTNEANPTYTFTDKRYGYATLYAYSPLLCVDSITKNIPITLADQRLDIVDFTTFTTANGYIEYHVQVVNTGNSTIRLIEFELHNPQFPTLSEVWQGELAMGKVLNYTFTSKTKEGRIAAEYLCMSAHLRAVHNTTIYYTDSECKDFSNEFGIYRITPNPAQDKAVVQFNTTQAGTLDLVCTDNSGKEMHVVQFVDLEPGYHATSIDVSQFHSGTYIVRIVQNKQASSMKFVKLRE